MGHTPYCRTATVKNNVTSDKWCLMRVTDAGLTIAINDFMFTEYIVRKRHGARVVTSGLFWV